MGATVGVYFDNRMAKEGEYYIKYVVYHGGKQKYYSTGTKLDSEDVDFLKKYKTGLTGGVRDPYKRNLWDMVYGQTYVNDLTDKIEKSLIRKAEEIIAKLGPAFTFEKFKTVIKEDSSGLVIVPKKNNDNILEALEEKAVYFHSQERFSDEDIFRSAKRSLSRFCRKDSLLYTYIDIQFLRKYEKWMLKEGRISQKKKDGVNKPASITTVGIYLRAVRSMMIEWVGSDPLRRDLNPFGEKGYIIPAGLNIKKALSKEEITKIIQFQPKGGSLMAISRDLWLFSYLCNGINFADMLELKWIDVDRKNDHISFVRQKTSEKKKSKQNKIQIDMFPITWEIIDRWGNDPKEMYIFPFYKKDMNAEEKRKLKRQAIKNTNKWMAKIAEELEITIDVKTYSARHSFATILLQSEVPLAFISQKLDHASILTTQKYLGSFEDKQVKKYLNALLPDEN